MSGAEDVHMDHSETAGVTERRASGGGMEMGARDELRRRIGRSAGAVMLMAVAVLCFVGVVTRGDVFGGNGRTSELMSWQDAHNRMEEHDRLLKSSQETEEAGWPDTPAVFTVPPINNEPNRPDLGYWATDKQPTPLWVDLPDNLAKPPEGEPGPEGVPESGSSDIRWGAPVVRKMPEELLEQIHRMAHLVRKVKESNVMQNLLLNKQMEEINRIKTAEQGHVDAALQGVNTDVMRLKSKVNNLTTKQGPSGLMGDRGIPGVDGFPGSPGKIGARGPKGRRGPRGYQGDVGDPSVSYYST